MSEATLQTTLTDSTHAAAAVAEARARLSVRPLFFLLLLAGVFVVFIGELMIGTVSIPLADILKTLVGIEPERATWARIIIDLRLPRAVTALFAGAALGVSGLLMQTLFRNPLASPWTLGLAAGAGFGVAIVVVVAGAAGVNFSGSFSTLGSLSLAAAAAAGSTLVLLLILAVSKRVSTVTLLVVGLMLHYLFEGFISVVLHFTDPTQARVYSGWEDGSFANITWSQIRILIPVVIVGLLISYLLVKPLNALLLGENYARTLGLTVGQARLWAFGSVAVLAGAVTAYCGPVVFLGIAVPHLCRGLFNTSDHRTLVPATILMGSLLALTADLVTHLPWQKHVFHLNTVNALIGAPVVLWIILRRKNMRSLEL